MSTTNTKLWTTPQAITTSDSTVYNPPLRGLQVGGAGVVAIVGRDPDGTVVQMTVPAGGYVLCEVSKVMATNTTATLIVGGL